MKRQTPVCRIQSHLREAMASRSFEIQPPQMKFPVPPAFLHVLSVSECFYARPWISDCSNLASPSFSSAGMQLFMNSEFGDVAVIPRFSEG